MKTLHRALCAVSFVGVAATSATASAAALEEMYQLARSHDQTLKIAEFRRDAAREAAPQARGPIFPQITASADARYNEFRVVSASEASSYALPGAITNQGYGSSDYAITLSQVLFDWTAFANTSAAERSVAEADASFASAEQNLIVRLVSAYLSVLYAQDVLQADRDLLVAYKQQLDQSQATVKQGVAPLTDLKNAQAAHDGSQAIVLRDLSSLDNAKRALGVIIGAPVGEVGRLSDQIALVPPNPSNVENWAQIAVNHNPDVVAARFGAQAADRQVSATWGRHLPTLNLVGQLGGENTRNSIFGADTVNDYIGVNVRWNIFQGGQVASAVRQAEANSRQLSAQYELAKQQADQNARNDYEGVVNGISVVNASVSALNSQQNSMLATEVGYKVGIRTIIDLINSRQLLASAQKAYSQSRYQYLSSLLSLKSDVGQLTRKDVEEIDRMLVKSP